MELGEKQVVVRRTIHIKVRIHSSTPAAIQDGGLDCLHLSPSKLAAGGGVEGGGGWLATWRVLSRSSCSRRRTSLPPTPPFIYYFFYLAFPRSVFLSEDGRKVGGWRCSTRVTAVLLAAQPEGGSGEDGSAEDGGGDEDDSRTNRVKEEPLLLAGDTRVIHRFHLLHSTLLLLYLHLHLQGQVWQYLVSGPRLLPTTLPCPLTGLAIHSGGSKCSGMVTVILISSFYPQTWLARCGGGLWLLRLPGLVHHSPPGATRGPGEGAGGSIEIEGITLGASS